jgi:HemY protein
MIKLLLLVIALIAGIIVSPDLAGHQGYVLISFANQTIEMSLTTLIIVAIAIVAIFFVLEFILRRLFSVGSSTRGWFSGRHIRKARRNTAEGLLKVAEGDWKSADVKLQIRQQQFEQALATLQDVQPTSPRNPMILSLLKQCYLQLEDWKALQALLPQLTKANVITAEEAAQLDIQAQCGQMHHLSQQNGSDGLIGYWNSINRKDKHNPALVACFVKQMIVRHADSEAFPILRDAIKKNPEHNLISLMPQLTLPDRHPAIVSLQDLLANNSNNPTLQSALGQMLMADGQWQPAKEHLEKAVAIRPDVTDFAHLVATLEQLGDKQAAAEVSRQALQLAKPDQA